MIICCREQPFNNVDSIWFYELKSSCFSSPGFSRGQVRPLPTSGTASLWPTEKGNGHPSLRKSDSGWNSQLFTKKTCREEVSQATLGAETWEGSSEGLGSRPVSWERKQLSPGPREGPPGLGLHAGLSVQAAADFSQEVRRRLQQGKNQLPAFLPRRFLSLSFLYAKKSQCMWQPRSHPAAR